MKDLQEIINNLPPDGVHELEVGEFEANLMIDKPIKLKGKGYLLFPTLIGRRGSGAIITILSPGVILENLQFDHEDEDQGITIQYIAEYKPELKKVELLHGVERELQPEQVEQIVVEWKIRDRIARSLKLSEYDIKMDLEKIEGLAKKTQTQFETEDEFKERIQKEKANIVKNIGFFQIGFVDLGNYDLASGKFEVGVRYSPWLEEKLGKGIYPEFAKPFLDMPRQEAKALYEERRVHPLYGTLFFGAQQVFVQPNLFVLGMNRLPFYLKGQYIASKAHAESILSFVQKDHLLFSGDSAGYIQVWDIQEGMHAIRTLRIASGKIELLLDIPDSQQIIAIVGGKNVVLFDAKSITIVFQEQIAKEPIRAIATTSNGKFLLAGCMNGSVLVWDIAAKKVIRTHNNIHNGIVSAIAVSPNDRYAFSAGKDQVIAIWEIDNGKVLKKLKGHDESLKSLSISSTQPLLASAGNTIKIWDIKNNKVIHSFIDHHSTIASVHFSPDSRFLVSASWDKTIKLWKIENGSLYHTFVGHKDAVEVVRFDPTGDIAYSVGRDAILVVWNLD